MGKYISAGNIDDLADGSKKKVLVEGQEIMLARVGQNYYALANRCPHLGGDLSMGKLEGNIITCPRHGSQFNIRTGENLRWMKGTGLLAAMGKAIKSPRSVQSYKVKVEGNDILVEI